MSDRDELIRIVADTIRPVLQPGYDPEGVAQTVVHRIARRMVRARRTRGFLHSGRNLTAKECLAIERHFAQMRAQAELRDFLARHIQAGDMQAVEERLK